MKRLIALIIAVISLMNITTYAQLTDEVFLDFLTGGSSQAAGQEAGAVEQLILHLGFLNDSITSYTPDDKIKYSDFKSAMCVFIGVPKTIGDDEFKDFMINEGYAREESGFNKISVNDVLYAFVTVMDCGLTVKQGNTSESQIYSIAKDKKILNNIKVSTDKIPTKREFANMIYNVLIGDSFRVENEGSGAYSKIVLLEDVFDIHLIKGVVTGFLSTSLQKNNEIQEGKVEIESIVYNCGELDFRDYVGYTVAAFIDSSDKEDIDIIAYEISSSNEVVKVSSSQVKSVSNTAFKYWEDNKEKQLKLDNNAVLIYNGIQYGNVSSIDWSSLAYKNSEYVFISNDNNRTYDVIYMWKYDYFTIKYVDETMVLFDFNMMLNGENSLRLDDDDIEYTYLYEGKRADATCLSAGGGIAVAESINSYGKKAITFDVSNRKVLGVIKQLSNEDGKYTVNINDKTYTVSDNYAKACGLLESATKNPDLQKLEPGVSVEATVTYNDVLVGAVLSGTYGAYGFLIKLIGDEDESIYRAKILDTDGNIVFYDFAEKVTYCDGVDEAKKRYEPDAVIKSIKSLPGTNPADTTDYRTVILYNLDSAGKINTLYMPYHNLDNTPGFTNFKHTYDYTSERKLMGEEKDDSSLNYAGYIQSTIPRKRNYWLGQYGMVFIAPSVENKDVDNYYTVDIISKYRTDLDGNFDNIYLFGVNKFFQVGCSLIYDNSAVNAIPRYSSESYMITGVEEAINKDNDVGINICYQKKGVEHSAFLSDKIEETVGSHMIGVPVSELKKGDIVQLAFDSVGTIVGVRLIFRMSELNNESYKYDTGNGKPIPVQLYYGNLLDKDQGQNLLLITLDLNAGQVANQMVRCGSYKNFEHYPTYYKYYKSSGKLEPIKFENLVPGKDVIIIASLDFAYEVYMIED